MAVSLAALSWAEGLTALLRERGGELRLQDFAPAYKAKFRKAFRPADYHGTSLEELCSSVEGVELAGTGPGRLVRLAHGQSANTKDVAELKARLLQLLKRHPGSTFQEVKNLWLADHGEPLHLPSYNVSATNYNDFMYQTASVCKQENGRFYPVFSASMVEQLVQVQRDTLGRSQSHFYHGKIIGMVCQELGVAHFETLGLGRPWKLPCLNDLIKLEQNIDIYIDAYLATHPIATVWDLEKSILAKERDNNPRLRSYSDLRIGPLLRHPKVVIEFQPPPGMSVIPEVSGKDVVEALRKLITSRRGAKSGSKIQPKEIIEALAEVKGVHDPLMLCARATKHIGHYISLVGAMRKRAMDLQRAAEKQIESQVKKEVGKEAEEAKKRVMARQLEKLEQNMGHLSLLEATLEPLPDRLLRSASNAGISGWLLSDLATFSPPGEAIGEAGDFQDRVDVLLWHAAKHLPEGMTATALMSEDQVQSFASALLDPANVEVLNDVFECLAHGDKEDKSDREVCHLQMKAFMTVDCFGQTLLQVLARHAALKRQESEVGPEGSVRPSEGHSSTTAQATPSPPFEEVHSVVAQHLGALIPGAGIDALANAERAVAAAMGAADFHQLGHGSLLEFAGASSTLASLAQRATGMNGASAFSAGSAMLAPEELAAQVLAVLPSDATSGRKEAAVAAALARHCGVAGVEDLRLGCSLSDFVSAAGERLHQPGASITGAAALLAASSDAAAPVAPQGTAAVVGLLGEVDREAAGRCLAAAPPLADLLSWTHWAAVFEPSLGPLPEFLRSSQGSAGNLPRALATADGRLLKLPDGSGSPDGLAAAIKSGSAEEAAAELLAAVVACGSLELSPLPRLVTAATAGLSARLSDPPGDAASVWLEIAALLPQELRAALAGAVLLPAFSEAAGKHHTHMLLLEAAEGNSAMLSMLTVIGLELGETAWSDPWTSQWQQSDAQKLVSDNVTSLGNGRDDKSFAGGRQADTANLPSWLSAEPPAEVAITAPGGEGAGDLPVDFGADETLVAMGELEATPQPPGLYMDNEAAGRGSLLEAAEAVVEDIRKKLGILPRHAGMDEDVQRCLDEYPKLMGNACDKLSTELYSKDSHFVLELIQNADDNTYGAGVSPAVCFVVGAANSITVLNNEVGFNDRNIQALCSVGDSTKQKQAGYIGQKGIGFKSVFRITDKPSVHSGGYHIAFDIHSAHGKLNYILPTWVGPQYLPGTLAAAACPELTDELRRPQWRTAIHLPLKASGIRGENGVKFQFEDIDPSMLLFLRKLRHVTVWDAEAGTRREMRRQDSPNGVVHVHCGGGQAPHSFLVVRRAVQPGVPRLGVAVEETEVCAALALGEGTRSAQQQPVFAFLPVASYGLRFILQADFVLPSSRESINVNNEWNQRLREEVPRLFVDIVEACKQLAPPGQEAAAAELWLRCVPLEGEVRDFFRPSVEAVHRAVAGMPCVLVEGGAWVQPCEALLASNAAMRELVQAEGILQEQGLRVVHPDLYAFAPALKAVGVKQLGWEHLVSVLERAAASSPQRLADLPWLASVLTCLQQCMAEGRLPPRAVEALRRLRVLPVEGGAFVSAAEAQVYFPLAAAAHGAAPGSAGSSAVAAAVAAAGLRLSGVVQLLRPELMEEMAERGRRLGAGDGAAAQALLRQLGVQPLTLHELAERHLVPRLLGGAAAAGEKERKSEEDVAEEGDAEEEEEELAAMLGVVRHHYASLSSEADRAALSSRLAGLAVLTTSGVQRLSADDGSPRAYLSSAFGRGLLPPSLLAAVGWAALDPSYLMRGGKAHEWRGFFQALGARELPAPTPFRREVSRQEKAADPAMMAEEWGHGPYILQDWRCPEVEELLGATLGPAERQALADFLDSSWDSHFSGFSMASLLPRPDPHRALSLEEAPGAGEQDSATCHGLVSTPVPSTFLRSLRHSDWLPARSGALHRPEQLFNMGQRDVADTLYGIQAYLPVLDTAAAGLRSHGFRQAIGLERRVSPSMLLDALRHCAAHPDFRASTEAVQPVYNNLASMMRVDPNAAAQVHHAMAGEALFYLPGRSASQPSWYPVGNVRLRDNSGVIEQVDYEKIGLRAAGKRGRGKQDPGHTRYYEVNHMDAFFSSLAADPWASVPRFPAPQEYFRVLEAIARDSETVTSEQLNLVVKVFTMWAEGIKRWHEGNGKGIKPEEVASWIEPISPLRIFPTTNKTWCSLADGVYICDDDELAKAFMTPPEAGVGSPEPEAGVEEDMAAARARAARSAAIAKAAAAEGQAKTINFLHVPPPDTRSQRGGQMAFYPDTSILPFLDAMRIPRLSASVAVRIVTQQMFFGRPITNLVADLFPCVQRWIFSHRGRAEYIALEEHLNGEARQRKLDEFSCEVMAKVEAEYSLKDRVIAPVFVEQPVILDADSMRLVVSTAAEREFSVVFRELSRLFTYGKVDADLVNFMVRVAFEAGGAGKVDMARFQADLGDMDADVVPWEVKRTQLLVTDPMEAADVTGKLSKWDDAAGGSKAADATMPGRMAKAKEDEAVQVWPPPRPRDELEQLRQQISPAPVGVMPEFPGGTPQPPGSSGGKNALSLPAVEPTSAFILQQQQEHHRQQPPLHHPLANGGSCPPGAEAASREAPVQTREHHPSAHAGPVTTQLPHSEGPWTLASHRGADNTPTVGSHAGSPWSGGGAGASNGGSGGGGYSEACKLALRNSLGALQLVPLEVPGTMSLGGDADVLLSSLADEDKQLVGRVGEELVYRWLRRRHEGTGAVVEWVNYEAESGMPYDIRVTRKVAGAARAEVEYVEVKSSSAANKLPFEVSLRELRFAEQHGPAYLLIRLLGVAAGLQPTMMEIRDPALQLQAGVLSLVAVPEQ